MLYGHRLGGKHSFYFAFGVVLWKRWKQYLRKRKKEKEERKRKKGGREKKGRKDGKKEKGRKKGGKIRTVQLGS